MSEVDIIYVLEEWKVYPDKSQIERDGNIVHLEPKIMEVLVYLIQNANRVISREELTEHVWQSKYASDEVITRAISVLRKKLDDTGKVHRFVKTIPKHGYVLEYDGNLTGASDPVSSVNALGVSEQQVVPMRQFFSLKWLVPLIGFILVMIYFISKTSNTKPVPVKNKDIYISIQEIEAIDNLSSSVMVARVLSEQLLTTLSNSDSAKVSLNGPQLNDDSTAQDENIYVISGGVKQVNEEYHVNIHFSDAYNGNVLWSQSFAGDKNTWHNLINNISKTIDHFITVAKTEKLDLTQLSLKELQASILIYQTKELRLNSTLDDILLSIDLLSNASLTYPDNANIAFELALSLLTKQYYYQKDDDLIQVNQLIAELGSTSSIAHKRQFIEGFYGFKNQSMPLKDSIELLENALADWPEGDTNVELLTVLGDLYRLNAQPEKASEILNEALIVDRHYAMTIFNLSKLLSQQSQHQRAISLLRTYLNNHLAPQPLNLLLVQLYIGTGEFDKAINFINKLTVNAEQSEQSEQSELMEYKAKSYYSLLYMNRSQSILEQIKLNPSPAVQYQRQCRLFKLQFMYQEAEVVCQQADMGAIDQSGSFHLAHNYLLQGQYKKALVEYTRVFSEFSVDISDLPENYLINEKVDYIWLLWETGQLNKAADLAKPLLSYLTKTNRLGYKGFGVLDVILLIASNQPQEASLQFAKAIESGWSHWFDLHYNGPHPALRNLKLDKHFPQWKEYLEQTLNGQRQNLIDKPEDQLPIFIN